MNILVVYCHPLADSFTASVRDRVVETLQRRHDVRLTDLYADEFQPALSAEERHAHREFGVSDELQPYADDLRWCEAIVFVYPTWWSGMPSVLKGWVDRVWARGIAWDLPPGVSTVRGRLRNVRRLAIVTTHGSARWVNLVEGHAGRRMVFRTLRLLCHPLVRTTWLPLYEMDSTDDATRSAFLDRVERRLLRW